MPIRRTPLADAKAAHAAALERAQACPCCGAPLLLAILGDPPDAEGKVDDEDLARFAELYAKLRAERRIVFDTVENAAQLALEGHDAMFSNRPEDEG